MQDQLNKLSIYCSKNLLSVNETKTKCKAIGHIGHLNIKFNGKYVGEVENYKYLCNMLRFMSRVSEDILCETYP